MKQFADELETHGLQVQVEVGKAGHAMLRVLHGDEVDFQYSVATSLCPGKRGPVATEQGDGKQSHFRAEVALNEGGKDYDVMGWTQKQILQDILAQYEKHLHFLHLLR